MNPKVCMSPTRKNQRLLSQVDVVKFPGKQSIVQLAPVFILKVFVGRMGSSKSPFKIQFTDPWLKAILKHATYIKMCKAFAIYIIISFLFQFLPLEILKLVKGQILEEFVFQIFENLSFKYVLDFYSAILLSLRTFCRLLFRIFKTITKFFYFFQQFLQQLFILSSIELQFNLLIIKIISEEMQDSKGKHFSDKYERLQFLGKGTFGSAYKIRNKQTSEIQAAKFISLVGMSEKQILKADAQRLIHSQLSHPNILKFCESYLQNQTLIFVMEYCEYGDLQVFLKKRKQDGGQLLPESVVMNIFLQLLFGLHYLHDHGIIHRDLKPSNIFVGSSGSAKIADFGISKVLNPSAKFESSSSSQSSSGSLNIHLTGTPMYASPEVCRNQQITFKSDIWSIACVLYELCTLKPAFSATNILALATKINSQRVESIGEGYSEDLAALIHWMLEKNPNQRPNAEEILGLTFIKKYIKAFENQKNQYQQQAKYITPKKSSPTKPYNNSAQKSGKTADSSPTYAIIQHQQDLVDERQEQEEYYRKLKQSCVNLMGNSSFNQLYQELKQLNQNFIIINQKDRKKINHELMKIYGQQYYDLAKAVLQLVEFQIKSQKIDLIFDHDE